MRENADLRTDLAIEASEMMTKRVSKEISGVKVETAEPENFLVTKVTISDIEAARIMNKPIGHYVTIESAELRQHDETVLQKAGEILCTELRQMAERDGCETVLIVGLGNRNITADALGPKTLEHIVVSRHLYDYFRPEIRAEIKKLCAIEPGVLGITGLETAEIMQGLTARIKPDVVIAIDALAAAATRRLNATIQLADTGIHPGSGVDNKRFGLTKASLGVPVIAIGIPTVVHAVTIAADTIQLLQERAEFSRYFKSMRELKEGQQRSLIREIMPDELGELVVATKDADSLTDELAKTIAMGINKAFYNELHYENLGEYLAT